jgi:hypothetical protein
MSTCDRHSETAWRAPGETVPVTCSHVLSVNSSQQPGRYTREARASVWLELPAYFWSRARPSHAMVRLVSHPEFNLCMEAF